MNQYRGVIFDLDGVIVSTDDNHYTAWKRLADERDLCFDRKTNERLRGVSRMQSLEIILEGSKRKYTEEEKLEMASLKNQYYIESLESLKTEDILPGVLQSLEKLKKNGIKIAIGSSSKNAAFILKKIGLSETFDAVADGNQIQRSKPDPEVFLLAAKLLEIPIRECIVVEDAVSGVQAALDAGAKAVAVGSAGAYFGAVYCAENLSNVNFDSLFR